MSVASLPAAVRTLLDGANVVHLATLLPDGSPHSVPVWIGVEGDRLAILTSPRSRKARNIDRDPRVAISVTDAANPFSAAWLRGRVVDRVEDDRAWEIIDRISTSYTGGPYQERTDRIVLLIDIEHSSGQAFG
jgi:PPOX class probable F420-dependent enzyme